MGNHTYGREGRSRGGGRVPELSGLKYLIVGLLFGGEMTSAELRDELNSRAGKRSLASFSRLMMRLLKASVVDVTYRGDRASDWHGRKYSERHHVYRATDLGVILWKEARDFYLSLDPPAADFKAEKVTAAKYAHLNAAGRLKKETEELAEVLMKLAQMPLSRRPVKEKWRQRYLEDDGDDFEENSVEGKWKLI